MTEFEKQVIEGLAELKAGQNSQSSKLVEVEDTLSTFSETLSDVQASISSLTGKIELQQKDLSHAEGRLDKLEAQRELQLQVNEIVKEDINKLDRKVEKVQDIPGAYNRLSKEITELKTKTASCETVATDLATLKEQVSKDSNWLSIWQSAFSWFMNKAFWPMLIASYIIYDKVIAP